MPVFDMIARQVEDVAEEVRNGTHGDLATVTSLAMEFRQQADAGEHNFILFLRAIELSGIWNQVDAGNFLKFLERNHICGPERYTHGVRTLQLIPIEHIPCISFAAAKEIAKIPDPPRREQALERTLQWAQDNGRPPSPETTRRLAGIIPVTQETPAQRRERELREENVALRREVDRLRALVLTLGGDPDARPEAAAE